VAQPGHELVIPRSFVVLLAIEPGFLQCGKSRAGILFRELSVDYARRRSNRRVKCSHRMIIRHDFHWITFVCKEAIAEGYANAKYRHYRHNHYAGVPRRRIKPPKLFVQKLLVALVQLRLPL